MKQSKDFLRVFVVTLCIFSSTTMLAQNYPEGMVSYWKGEGNAVDACGDNDGTLMNGATATATGQVGQAFSFDGNNDYVGIADDPSLVPEELSVEVWFYLPKPSVHVASFVRKLAQWSTRYSIYALAINQHNELFINLYTVEGRIANTIGIIPTIGEWHHFAMTYPGSVYYDGENVYNLPYKGQLSDPDHLPLYIGSSNSNYQVLDGLVDEVAIYNRALTAVEINQHYQNGLNGLGYEIFIPIVIDIKPGSDPNCFNNDGHGVIPVAILGSAEFDVTQIDPASVRLEGLDIKAVGKSNKLLARIEDVNSEEDDFDDLIVQIEDQDGLFGEGSSIATVTGNLFNGTHFQGTDEICIVPPVYKSDVNPNEDLKPEEYALHQNYPNPFNAETEIRFQLLEDAFVVLKIYNKLGQEICVLAERAYETGFHQVIWGGKDSNGNYVASGIYIYTIQAGTYQDVKKMVLFK